ncbi:2-oxo-4-hydroxy-4-carboxy-5-ureidoimidazoline decarboxylase [Thalassolituus sp. UBA2009]|uniref:2-oxo-4-hydroxy-4-carboxy-5-ureidoimidazoline decarboxylase n=1 Tax=Thalassolituus sp. UBA2009 TaxID=1947658 RepID=UPI00257B49F8|nr:2-oxo-4-hydroxy-4-carboxy-5-ureidoimidazoline decarboxylase [Thalassolituus sp. UBA2009]
MTLDELNNLTVAEAIAAFTSCCAAERWVEKVVAARPYASVDELLQKADEFWWTMEEPDFLQAFTAHPKIGDVNSLRAKYANTKAIASHEQSGATGAPEAVLEALAAGNSAYEEKFGFIFIVFATGKSAGQMLALLEQRLPNSREQEIRNAAENQMMITDLRIKKILGPAT